jgi:hypothetical protein
MIMWNNEENLRVLDRMPEELNDENLATMQKVFDIDKFKSSVAENRDLCGAYAPFCNGCDKTGNYPCAASYVKMRTSEGAKISVVETEEKPVVAKPKRTRVAVARKKAN